MKYETNILTAATLIAFGTYPVDRDRDMEKATFDVAAEYESFSCPAVSIAVRDYSKIDEPDANYEPTVNQKHKQFRSLVNEWRRATSKLSLIEKAALHPSYQRIIGMGEQALPFIFDEMNERGGHWLWALQAITGRDDVAKEGDTFRQATAAWLKWGRAEGYL